MKEMLDGLSAVHSASEAYTVEGTQAKYDKKTAITYSWDDSIMDEVVHPVIRTHPETGRKALYVNDMFTLRIQGMSKSESRALLDYLFIHATAPNFAAAFAGAKTPSQYGITGACNIMRWTIIKPMSA